MYFVLVYDIPTTEDGKKRWQKVFKRCKTFGFHVQDSVFEFNMDYSMYTILKHDIENLINKDEDSVRIYVLGKERTDNNTVLLGHREIVELTDNNIVV